MLYRVVFLLAVTAQKSMLVEGGLIDDLYSIPTTSNDDRNWDSAYNNFNFDAIANLDLDLKYILARLAPEDSDGLSTAQKIFENGGFADPYAVLKISDPEFLNLDVKPGTPVFGTSANGETIGGTVNFGSPIGDDTLEVHYSGEDLSGSCRVGGTPNPTTSGCFVSSGGVSIDISNGSIFSFFYTYDPFANNLNGITLATLDKHRDVSTSQTNMNRFKSYYSDPFFDREWIRSAFAGTSTPGESGKMDFQKFGFEGRAAAIRLGIVVFRVWMFVVNSVEDAVSNCATGVPSADRWDQAVAAYSGSELIEFGESGYFLFTLAETECLNFGTCTQGTNPAPINQEIFQNFRQGKANLLQGNCDNARDNAQSITKLMTVPLIQGILRLTHDLDWKSNSQESTQGQVAAYAAAILPILDSCNKGNAFIIYDDLAPGNAVTSSFEVVKAALERSYDCLGVTCEDIGGLLNLKRDGYEIGAEPCGKSTISSSQSTPTQAFAPTRQPTRQPTVTNVSSSGSANNNSEESYANSSNNSQQLAIGISIGVVVLAALIAVMQGFIDHKNMKQFDTGNGTAESPAGENVAGGTGDEAAMSTKLPAVVNQERGIV